MQEKMIQNRIDSFSEASAEILSGLRMRGDASTISHVNAIEKKLKCFLEGVGIIKKNNSLLTIGIVGQMKVGKSSFLNAFLFKGEPVLPKAATPMTAGLTIIEKSPDEGKEYLEVEYFTKNEWESIRATANDVERCREEILRTEPTLAYEDEKLNSILKDKVGEVDYASYLIVNRLTPEANARIGCAPERISFNAGEGMAISLKQYVGARGKFTSVVKALHLYIDNENLDGLRIVDTPGVNDPVVTRDAKTSEFLREAHGVLMLMSAMQPMSATDIDLLNERIGKEGISSIVLVVNKIDMPCCCGQYRNGYKLRNAYESVCRKFSDFINQKKGLFSHPENIKGVVFTSGVADSLAQKLPNHPEKMDADEQKALENLKNIYPDDFTEENMMESLHLLAEQNETLYDEYIKKVFIFNKDTIISGKLSAFVKEYSKDILRTIDEAIEEKQNEIRILKSGSLDTIQSQEQCLKKILVVELPAIRTRIKSFIATLYSEVKKEFQNEMVDKEPKIPDLPTDTKSIEYTRKSTRLGLNKSGTVTISQLNSTELYRMEEPQVEKLRKSVLQFWNGIFIDERTSLVNYILDRITEMAQKSSDMDFDDSLVRNLVNSLVQTQLNGMETVEILDKCESFKITFRDAMNMSCFIDIDTVLHEMGQSEAEETIKQRVRDNLFSAWMQIEKLNSGLYNDLKGQCDNQCHTVREIMERFSKEFETQFIEQIDALSTELQKKLQSRAESIKAAESILNDFKEIKKVFNEIYGNQGNH